MPDFVQRVITWNAAAGNTSDHFNVRQTALYIGLICEELSELFAAAGDTVAANTLSDYAYDYKNGFADSLVENSDRVELLDACCDISVVTVGCMMSQGADVHGALAEVCDSNDSKSVKCSACDWLGTHHRFDGEFMGSCPICNERGWILQKNEHGKIQKGENYRAPDLSKFICKVKP